MKTSTLFIYLLVLAAVFVSFDNEALADARSDAAAFCSEYNREKGVNMCQQQRCPCGRATTRVARFDASGMKVARCACVNKTLLAEWEAEQNTLQCKTNNDCNDGVWCNGEESCSAGQCQAGTPPCGDGVQCFERTDSCAVVCEDNDGDGFTAIHCGGNDCDDNNANRSPGNVEICDARGIDEDCDPTTVGNLDRDGDGFVSPQCK